MPLYETLDGNEISWDNGEVEWDFASREYNHRSYFLEEDVRSEDVICTSNEKGLKIIDTIEKTIITDAVFSGALKSLYNEMARMDTFLEETNEFLYDNVIGENIETDAFLIAISLFLGFHFSRKKINISSFSQLDPERKRKHIQDYKKIQKMTQLLFLVFLFVFTKNIRNAE